MIVKIKMYVPDGYRLYATANLQDDGPTAILGNGGNWENRVISISQLSRNIGEDKTYEISGMSIEFNDTDRMFRKLMSGTQRFIVGKKVELYTEDDRLIYTGTIEKWQFKEDAFVLNINDRLSGLETLIPGIISLTDYPGAAVDADGQAIPVIYGEHVGDGVGAVKCWRVETVESEGIKRGVYLLARHHCKELLEVYDKEGIAQGLTNFQLDPQGTAGQDDELERVICIDTLEDFIDDWITVDVKGKKDGTGDLIEDPITALKDMVSYGNMTYNTESLDEAAAIMNKRGYKIAAVIDGQQNLNDALVTFCFSFDCDFYIGKQNEIVISMLDWSDVTPKRSFDQTMISEFSVNEEPEQIRNKVKYQYKYDYVTQKYRKMPVFIRSTSVDEWGEFYNRNQPLDLKYVPEDLTAFDVVQRYVIQHKNPQRIANFTVSLSEFVGLDISDIIEIQHPSAIIEGKRKYRIRRINIDFVTDVVQVEADDITSMTGGMFVLGDKGWTTEGNEPFLFPEWSAKDEFSRNYGYLACRDTGYFENGIDYGKVLY
jgi:hypothetical protein